MAFFIFGPVPIGDNNLINGNDNSGSVLFLFNSNLSLVTGIIIQTVVS